MRELADLIARGHQIGPGTITAVTGALDAHESPARVLEDVVWRHRGLRVAPKTVNQKRYVDSVRDNTITFGVGPGGHRQDVPGGRDGGGRAVAPRGQPHHPHAAGGRGGRAPGLPAGRSDGQGRSLSAPAVRRAARHARPREGLPAHRARGDRDRAAGVHARAHAERLVRDPRRGAEHDARADEDVPHPPGLRLEDGGDGGRHAGRPSPRAAARG